MGCNKKEKSHFEMGFDFKIPVDNGQSSFLVGVKSDKRVFDNNDVTMDFYFGYKQNHKCPPDECADETNGKNYKFICDATYLYVIDDYVNNKIVKFNDYKNIDGFHLIKEYSKEEFLTEEKS